MAKVTEKQLKARVTELNLQALKTTTFGLKVERGSKGYSCVLVYRDATPPEVILEEGSASEASACVEAVATTHKVFTHSMLGSTEKPEYLTDEMFIKKAGERCPRTKCGSKDIVTGWIEKTPDGIDQSVRCTKCGLEYLVTYRMEGYEVASKVSTE